MRLGGLILAWLPVALLFVGCGAGSVPLTDAFTSMEASPDWSPAGNLATFDPETIFNLVDGQADAFFAYGFEQVAVGRYQNEEGTRLDIEVWQLAAPVDAYGLFTTNISGEPAAIGNEGDIDPGRRLAFWQDRYFVHIRARQELSETELLALAEAISAALPAGGERPALMDRLPTDGLVERSAIFFHQEISIQNDLWLGGQNLLGLSSKTNGVLARYQLDSTMVQLLLVQYQNGKAASNGLAVLKGAQIDGLVAADVRDDLLGAVFDEKVDEKEAGQLLAEALQ